MNKNIEKQVVFKNHPYMIFSKFFVWVLAVFFFCINLIKEFLSGDKNLKDIAQMASSEHVGGAHVWMIYAVIICLFSATILYGYFIWKNTMIICCERAIVFKKRGLFNRTEKQVSYMNISNVTVKRSLINRIFRVENLSLDINSSMTAKEDDYSIILCRKQAEKFRTLVTGRKNSCTEDNGFDDFSRYAVYTETYEAEKAFERAEKSYDTESTGKSYVAEFTGKKTEPSVRKTFTFKEKLRHIFINEAGKSLFGLAVFIGAVANTQIIGGKTVVTIIFCLCVPVMVSILKNINRYKGFSVARYDDYISIDYGLVDIREFFIPVEKIMAIEVEQNLAGRVFGCSKLTFEVIGTGNEKDETKDLSLYMKDVKSFAEDMIPEYSLPNKKFIYQDKSVAVWKGALYGGIFLFLAYFLELVGLIGFLRGKFWWLPPAAYGILAFCWLLIVLNNLFGHGLIQERDVIYVRNGILSRNINSIYLKNIEYIHINRSFFISAFASEQLCMKTRDSGGFSLVETGYYKNGTFSEVVKSFREGHRK